MLIEQTVKIAEPVVWYVDNLSNIGLNSASTIGAPAISKELEGTSASFDGVKDGLMVEHNPIAGLSAFTIEVLFLPVKGGGFEQRFLHMQENASECRALVELRSVEDNWYLDTYLHSAASQLTLITPEHLHPNGKWHWAALTYDGTTMRHFVNGLEESSGKVSFKPLGQGRTSIGMRQNQVSWFKGSVREVRVSTEPLAASRLQKR